MQRKYYTTLGDAIHEFLNDFHLNEKVVEVRLIESWSSIVGESIAKRTSNMYIKNKTLHVKVNSAVLRNELSMVKENLIKHLNESVNQTVITHIIFN